MRHVKASPQQRTPPCCGMDEKMLPRIRTLAFAPAALALAPALAPRKDALRGHPARRRLVERVSRLTLEPPPLPTRHPACAVCT